MERSRGLSGWICVPLGLILIAVVTVLGVSCTFAGESEPTSVPDQQSSTVARASTETVVVPTEPAVPSATPTAVPPSSPTPMPSPTATWTQTPIPVSPTPSATPDPLGQFYIETLRQRSYGGDGTINVESVWLETDAYTRYAISYPSDGLTVTGYMTVPHGDGPFPVIVLNHGYYDPLLYRAGDGTLAASDFLSRHGYLTIASDYRAYGGSDDGPNDFRVGYVIDVLNLLALLDTLPQADPERVGLWGHSMGGGIAINVMVIDDRPDAIVLYGPMSGDVADNWRHIRTMWNSTEMDKLASQYGSPEERPDAYRKMSAIEYLDSVEAPVQIHHGTWDEQVPYDWSVQLRDALNAADAPVELFSYEQVGHNFQGESWSLFMQRVLAFYDAHVK